MNRASAKGFTIIEVVLFLAITGGLFVALMVGVNSNITQQRYRETVSDLVSFLQDQYNEVNNPRNEERVQDLKCNTTTGVTVSSGSGQARGTSGCVLLGKAIMLESGGTEIKVLPVVGGVDVTVDVLENAVDDLAPLRGYSLVSSTIGAQSKVLDQGAAMRTINNLPSELSMLILRSPVNGLLYVFATEDSVNLGDRREIERMIVQGNQEPITQCIGSSDGGDISGTLPIYSITVDPRVSGPNGIRVGGEGDNTKCENVT